MFDELSGHRVPLLPGSEISRRPRRLVVASVPLVVWRTGDGRVGVLHDQCPHRGTALSLGRVTAEGSLECGFHGWRFDAGGSCLAVPFNPRADVGRLAATAFPVTEAAGLAWIHTSSDAVGRPGYDPALDEPDLARQVHWEEWDCHWTRAMENMLDFPHLPFVHRTTIGMFLRRVMRPDSEMTIAVEESANGFVATSRVDGRSTGAVLRWHAPAGMSLDIGPPGRTLVLNVWCVPSDRNRTRMILCAVRDFARDPLTAAALGRANLAVLHQDRAVVESSQPVVVPDPRLERSVPTDNPTLRFRTWYRRSQEAAPGRDRPGAARSAAE